MIVSGAESYRYVVHDRDSIYSADVDGTLEAMGLTVLKTPVRSSGHTIIAYRSGFELSRSR